MQKAGSRSALHGAVLPAIKGWHFCNPSPAQCINRVATAMHNRQSTRSEALSAKAPRGGSLREQHLDADGNGQRHRLGLLDGQRPLHRKIGAPGRRGPSSKSRQSRFLCARIRSRDCGLCRDRLLPLLARHAEEFTRCPPKLSLSMMSRNLRTLPWRLSGEQATTLLRSWIRCPASTPWSIQSTSSY
jgi:hypothetical protein